MSVYGKNLFRQYVRKQAYVNTGMSDEAVPLPAKIGMVSLEMGLNLQVAMGCKQYLMFHAGVIAKDGVNAVIILFT